MKIAGDATKLVGNTPMVWLDRLAKGLPGRIAAKLGVAQATASRKANKCSLPRWRRRKRSTRVSNPSTSLSTAALFSRMVSGSGIVSGVVTVCDISW